MAEEKAPTRAEIMKNIHKIYRLIQEELHMISNSDKNIRQLAEEPYPPSCDAQKRDDIASLWTIRHQIGEAANRLGKNTRLLYVQAELLEKSIAAEETARLPVDARYPSSADPSSQ